MEAAPNIPAVDAYLGSTVLQENILVNSLEQLFKLLKALQGGSSARGQAFVDIEMRLAFYY